MRGSRLRALGIFSSALVILLCGSACTSTGNSPEITERTSSAVANNGEYPVTIKNCGRSLTFDSAPKRVVTLWQGPTEMMLALGLQGHLAAIGGSYAAVPANLQARAKRIPVIGEDTGWPTREVLLSEEPDLVIPQLLEGFAFDTSRGFASVKEVEAGGAQVYSANSCNVAGNQKLTLDTVSNTLRDLGKIFGVSKRAEVIIKDLQAQRKVVTEAVSSLPKVRTAIYNGGDGPLTVLSGGNFSALIDSAGGKNVFPEDAIYISAEEFAACDAEVILVGTYPGQDFASLRRYLVRTFPELPAVKEGRIVELPVVETEVSVRIMEGLTRIAVALHPEAGLAVPVS